MFPFWSFIDFMLHAVVHCFATSFPLLTIVHNLYPHQPAPSVLTHLHFCSFLRCTIVVPEYASVSLLPLFSQ